MTQSVELLLDAASEARVRADWARLADAGLTSQSRHPSPTNRPHVTLAAVTALPEGAEDRLAAACADLPLRARLGPLAVLGQDPAVLVRLVVANAELLALHAQVAGAAGVARSGRGCASAGPSGPLASGALDTAEFEAAKRRLLPPS